MVRTAEVVEKVEKIARETPGIAHTIGNPGRSFVLNNAIGSNLGTIFITLKPFHERRDPALTADAIASQLRQRFQREIPEARLNVFGAPAVDFGSDIGKVFAVHPAGKLLWELDFGGELDVRPAIGADGTLFICHAGGAGGRPGGRPQCYAISDDGTLEPVT